LQAAKKEEDRPFPNGREGRACLEFSLCGCNFASAAAPLLAAQDHRADEILRWAAIDLTDSTMTPAAGAGV